jgi:ABC-type Fe3+-hydroxamate transport system substrate-binding protein
MQFTDQLGREIILNGFPERIVSLVPSQTQLLADLALADRVVGITRFCMHPYEWFRSKSRVGGTKDLQLEKIKLLQPDLIIGNKEENTKAHLEALAHEFPVWISDVRNLDQALQMIVGIGAVTDKLTLAEKMADQIVGQYKQFIQHSPPLKALYIIWKNPLMTINGDTFIHDMMQRAGFLNLAADLPDRYPVLTDAAIRAYQPEVILLSSEPFPFSEKHRAEFHQMAPPAKVMLVNGEAFSWYGSGLLHGLDLLKHYRELAVQQ